MNPNQPVQQPQPNPQPPVDAASPVAAPAQLEPQPEVQPAPQQVVSVLQQPTVPVDPAPAQEVVQQEQPQPAPDLPQIQPVQWQADEYTQHDKSPAWYIGFGLVIVALMAAAVLLMKSWTFAILIPVMAAALMVYSHRPPRQLNYVLSEKGLYINDQLHPMGEFKHFGILQDGVHNSLSLIPVKRFRPSLVVYFPSEVGERLVDVLGAYLPMKEIHPDAFDKIVRKLHL